MEQLKTCKHLEDPIWNEEYKKEENHARFFKSFIPDDRYLKYIIFISSNIYKECCGKLMTEKLHITNFHEVYGAYDFILKSFFEKSKEKEGKHKLEHFLLHAKNGKKDKCIKSEKNVVFKKVIEEYCINTEGACEKLTSSKCILIKLKQFNMISAFVMLSPVQNKPHVNVKDLLDLLASECDSSCNDIMNKLIYRIYLLENDELLLYLNIDCRNISNLNEFTRTIDDVVDKKNIGYTKTTFISTKHHFNNTVINNIKQRL